MGKLKPEDVKEVLKQGKKVLDKTADIVGTKLKGRELDTPNTVLSGIAGARELHLDEKYGKDWKKGDYKQTSGKKAPIKTQLTKPNPSKNFQNVKGKITELNVLKKAGGVLNVYGALSDIDDYNKGNISGGRLAAKLVISGLSLVPNPATKLVATGLDLIETAYGDEIEEWVTSWW